MRNVIRTVICTVILLTVHMVLFTPTVVADDTQKFKIPSGKSLRLDIPPELDVSSTKVAGDVGTLEIKIVPESETFSLLISGLPMDRQTKEFMEQGLEYLLLSRGKELLEQSVEDRIEIQELDPKKGVGFYYCLTDAREPLPEGEFRHICQGSMITRRLLLTYTLLMNDNDKGVTEKAHAILESAVYR